MNIQELIRVNIKSLNPYSSARNEFKDKTKDLIFMDANESPYDNGLNRYPDPQQTLVKNQLSRLKGIANEKIFLGNGSDEVLDLIFRMFCEPNQDNVIILPPTYGMYKVLAELNAIDINEVPLTHDFQPNIEQILAKANENTKILCLCSPNNPTGNIINYSSIEILLQSFKGIVVIDEAYIDFSNQESWITRLEQYPNLIITQTFSKAYGMASIRLGICYASSEIIKVLTRIKAPYNVNGLTQQKALEQLNNMAHINDQIKDIVKQREFLHEELLKINFIKTIYPSEANFILIKVDDATQRYNQLVDKGIVVRNRSSQLLCHNGLRITVGTKKENMNLIKAFQSL